MASAMATSFENMLEPSAPELLWVVILGFIIGFCLAFGVGANDVANSFGTSVGSKVLTLRQACILATIFEILGAVLMGHKVSGTIRKGIFDIEMYSEFEQELMLGYLSALAGSAIWNLVATFFRWPISGTHSIVGAVIGFSLVGRGFYSIKWMTLGKIVSSWFLSPVLSGLLSSCLFLIVKRFILSKEDAAEKGYLSLPYFYGFTIFINIFSVVHGGPSYLGFDQIPWWGVFILSLGVGLIVGLCIWYLLVPYLRKAAESIYGCENGDTRMEKIENHLTQVAANNVYSGGESNGVPITMEDLKTTDDINLTETDNSHTCIIAEEEKKKEEKKKDVVKPNTDVDSAETARMFSSLQVLTAIFGAFAHGANDVSNAIGPVVAIWLIYKDGNVMQLSNSPLWIMFYGGVGISLGLWIWGQKVIQTIGEDLTKISPSSGFTIEIGAATTVLLASKVGLPISTTHCKVGSVVFVGWARSKASVDWKLFRNIVLAWVLTLPVSGGLSAMMMAILKTATNS